MQHVRQGLAAEFLRRRQAVPAAGGPVAIEIRASRPASSPCRRSAGRPACRRCRRAGRLPPWQSGRLRQGSHRRDPRRDRREGPSSIASPSAGHMLQREHNFLDRCLVHIVSSASLDTALPLASGASVVEELIDFYVNVNFEFRFDIGDRLVRHGRCHTCANNGHGACLAKLIASQGDRDRWIHCLPIYPASSGPIASAGGSGKARALPKQRHRRRS